MSSTQVSTEIPHTDDSLFGKTTGGIPDTSTFSNELCPTDTDLLDDNLDFSSSDILFPPEVLDESPTPVTTYRVRSSQHKLAKKKSPKKLIKKSKSSTDIPVSHLCVMNSEVKPSISAQSSDSLSSPDLLRNTFPSVSDNSNFPTEYDSNDCNICILTDDYTVQAQLETFQQCPIEITAQQEEVIEVFSPNQVNITSIKIGRAHV